MTGGKLLILSRIDFCQHLKYSNSAVASKISHHPSLLDVAYLDSSGLLSAGCHCDFLLSNRSQMKQRGRLGLSYRKRDASFFGIHSLACFRSLAFQGAMCHAGSRPIKIHKWEATYVSKQQPVKAWDVTTAKCVSVKQDLANVRPIAPSDTQPESRFSKSW